MNLGERITRWRKLRGLRKTDLATAADVSISAVIHWEKNENAPTVASLNSIVELFDLTMEEFYGEIPKAKKAS